MKSKVRKKGGGGKAEERESGRSGRGGQGCLHCAFPVDRKACVSAQHTDSVASLSDNHQQRLLTCSEQVKREMKRMI